MLEYIITLIVFFAVVMAMGVGYFWANKTIKGTCGGLGALFGTCDVCDKKDECKSLKTKS